MADFVKIKRQHLSARPVLFGVTVQRNVTSWIRMREFLGRRRIQTIAN